MSDIPIHLQRKFEQRWSARFVTSAETATTQKQWPEKHDQLPATSMVAASIAQTCTVPGKPVMNE
jgi:hypothetical protein